MERPISDLFDPAGGAGRHRIAGAANQRRACHPAAAVGHCARLRAGHAGRGTASRTGAARGVAAVDLLGKRRHELARVQIQFAPDHAAVRRLRDLYRLRRCRGDLDHLVGLPWSVGFLLGAIVAPPDVVAPLAIARKLGMPRRILVVLEGEGLANDATALILYRFAVAAITTGLFSLPQGHRHLRGHRRRRDPVRRRRSAGSRLHARHRTRDPQVEITLSLITPYLAFWVPEHLGGSGVIATVACGLYMSWNGPLLISAATRLQGIFFWDLVIFLVEGLLFLLTGFQMRLLFEKSKAFPLQEILLTSALVVVIVIIARFAWVYPATYLPRLISKRTRERDPAPSWRVTFVLAFTGVRGAVSLAAALALPLALPGGAGFPSPRHDPVRRLRRHLHHAGRTWVGVATGGAMARRRQGRPQASISPEHEAEIAARREALDAALQVARCHHRRSRTVRRSRQSCLRARHEIRSNQLPDSLDPDRATTSRRAGTALTRELIAAERNSSTRCCATARSPTKRRRRIERDLDLEEASLSNREYRKIPL